MRKSLLSDIHDKFYSLKLPSEPSKNLVENWGDEQKRLLNKSIRRLAFIKSLRADKELIPYANAIRVSLFTPICERWEPSRSIKDSVENFFRLVDNSVVRELDSFFKVAKGGPKDFVWLLTHTRHNTIHLDADTLLPEADEAAHLRKREKAPITATGYLLHVKREGDYFVLFRKSTDKVIDLLIESFASYLVNKFSSP